MFWPKRHFIVFFILSLSIIRPAQADSVIRFCNESHDDLFVAAVIGTGNTSSLATMNWRERGWLQLPAGECSFVLRLRNRERSDFAIVHRLDNAIIPARYRPHNATGKLAFSHVCVNPFTHFNVALPSYSRPSTGCGEAFIEVPTSFGVIAGDNDVKITLN